MTVCFISAIWSASQIRRHSAPPALSSLKHVAGRLVEHGTGGSLIAIASLKTRQPAEGFTACCASKAAVAMIVQTAALELGRYGIRANAIGPGMVETLLPARLCQNPAIRDAFIAETPMGCTAQPEEVAELALYLAGDASGIRWG